MVRMRADTVTRDFTTAEYRAPEMLKKERYDFKLDIWSLGCIIYYMCALRHPFVDDEGFIKYKEI